MRKLLVSGLAILALANFPLASAQHNPIKTTIDAQRSAITVHVFRSGFFAVAGDNHEISAPIASGSIDGAARTVQLVINTGKMRVLDPNLSADKRNQVQQRMRGPDVLDSTRFPEITFRSQSAEQHGANQWLVRGDLTLHGQQHPVTVEVTRPVGERIIAGSNHYTGSATLKQSDFGIKPISIAGGAVKVKDEIKITFDIWNR